MLLGSCVLICVWVIPSVLACEKVHGTVVVKTADHYNAGTDDTVQMMILMDNDHSPWHNLESDPEGWRNDLETGATDTFVLKVCPEGRINGFILKHTGTNDWWFPEWVKISYPEQNPCIDCQLNQWLTLGRYMACLMDNFPMWNKRLHGNGYIEGRELEEFLMELIASASVSETSQDVVSKTAYEEVKAAMMDAFDENKDGRIDIGELAEILPMEQNFLLLFRRDNPLESSVEFMKVWREFDEDHSGCIEADELKHFLFDLLKQAKRETAVTEEQLIVYADTMLQLFDRNRDGKLQLSEMAKLLPVKENFLCRPVFKGRAKVTSDDVEKVFHLYDRDHNEYIENEELQGFLKDLMELVTDDYDTADLAEYKRVLLDHCDNSQKRINSSELKMILKSMTNQWTIDDSLDEGDGQNSAG